MKKFYATVQTLKSTTDFGRQISACVYAKYNHALLIEAQLPEIFSTLDEWTAAIIDMHPRYKKMYIHSHGFLPYTCGYGRLSEQRDAPQIWMSASKAPTIDDRKPFVLQLEPVEIDYTTEGGAV